MEKVDVSQIHDEITVEYLAEITKKMRHAKRRYFATRSKDVLAESNRLEALVDAVIAKLYDTQMSLILSLIPVFINRAFFIQKKRRKFCAVKNLI